MNKCIIIVFLILNYTETFGYGLSGYWTGNGKMVLSSGQIYDCVMQLNITHEVETFTVYKTDFDCGPMHIKNKTITPLKIQDEQLVYNDQVYGVITENKMISDLKTVDGRRQYYFMSLLTDTELTYVDDIEWMGGLRTQISGKLNLSMIVGLDLSK